MNKNDFEIIPVLEQKDRPVYTVVFSTDDNFAPPAGVAIASLLKVSIQSVFYDFVILDNGISVENRNRLLALVEGFEYASLRFCDVKYLLADVLISGPYSKATYLSLFVPYLFRTHEKVLFLDCDVVVCKDVSPLFETRFDQEYVAAVRDVGLAALARGNAPLLYKGRLTSWQRYAARYLNFTDRDYEDAVNTGLLLFNIPMFVEDGFTVLQGVERHIHRDYLLVDQCIINILFRNRIKYLHLRWDFQVQNWGGTAIGFVVC